MFIKKEREKSHHMSADVHYFIEQENPLYLNKTCLFFISDAARCTTGATLRPPAWDWSTTFPTLWDSSGSATEGHHTVVST